MLIDPKLSFQALTCLLRPVPWPHRHLTFPAAEWNSLSASRPLQLYFIWWHLHSPGHPCRNLGVHIGSGQCRLLWLPQSRQPMLISKCISSLFVPPQWYHHSLNSGLCHLSCPSFLPHLPASDLTCSRRPSLATLLCPPPSIKLPALLSS